MKKTSISIIALVIVYIGLSYVYSLNVFDSKTGTFSPNSYSVDRIYKKDDYTKTINSKLIEDITALENELRVNGNEKYTRGFSTYFMTYDGNNTVYYYVDADKVDDFIKKHNLKNPKNLKFTQNIKLPIENEKYKNIFANITKEKKKEKIVGKDKDGKDLYDISPDMVVLASYMYDIQSYAYVDNRLVDTRAAIGMETGLSSKFSIRVNPAYKEGAYNKYVLIDEDIEK